MTTSGTPIPIFHDSTERAVRLTAAGLFFAFWLISSIPLSSEAAEVDPIDRALQDGRYALEVTSAELGDHGASVLSDALSDARFIMIGEEHGFQQVSEFVMALYSTLAGTQGPPYLAVENGEWITRAMTAKEYRKNVEALAGLVSQYPDAVAFSADPELRLYSHVTQYCDGNCNLLWGIDQPYGASHILQAIVERESGEAAEAARILLSNIERMQDTNASWRYLYDARPVEELEQLAEMLSPGSAELAVQVSDLARSARIYEDHRKAAEGASTGLRANVKRELDMKERFARHYRTASEHGGNRRPVVVKIGANHIYRGYGPTNVLTLGNFVHELAVSENATSVHIAIFPRLDPRSLEGTPAEWAIAIMRAGYQRGWTLLDLRHIPDLIHSGAIPRVKGNLRRLLFGVDFVVLFAEPTPSPRTLTQD